MCKKDITKIQIYRHRDGITITTVGEVTPEQKSKCTRILSISGFNSCKVKMYINKFLLPETKIKFYNQ